jgi:HlyD family secretion protein
MVRRVIKSWPFAVLAIAIAAAAVPGYFYWARAPQTSYITAQVSRGPIVRTVSATGTVNPVTVVQVGTSVSGPIQAIYADFNSAVKAGQLIAKIDPRTFTFQVEQARAALENGKSQLAKDRADRAYKMVTYRRDIYLRRERAVSQDVVDDAKSAYLMADAQVELDEAAINQQQAALHQAEINLNYTNIVSPVDGVVVSRNVDVGQTVAASFQTPTLFLIARDLTMMQVDANVSESDVGYVRTGQAASFRVDAFPERDFNGAVRQIRQAPITVENVVSYDVVINVANPELVLKPGMTAIVTIATARRDNVIRVPITALRFSPRRLDASARAIGQSEQGSAKRVWVLKGSRLVPVPVTTGLDDGTYVEVVGGDLHPGDEVVTDVARPANPIASGSYRGPRF